MVSLFFTLSDECDIPFVCFAGAILQLHDNQINIGTHWCFESFEHSVPASGIVVGTAIGSFKNFLTPTIEYLKLLYQFNILPRDHIKIVIQTVSIRSKHVGENQMLLPEYIHLDGSSIPAQVF